MKDPGLAAALELARLMGLRSQEAVQRVQWIWGMGTGVGGMWRRCMGKFDSWLRASSGWSRLPPFTVSERLGGGGKYQAALPSPLQSKPESDRTNVEINERTCPE